MTGRQGTMDGDRARRRRRRATAIIGASVVLGVAACGGGTGRIAAPAVPAPVPSGGASGATGSAGTTATTRFTITIPRPAAPTSADRRGQRASRPPAYVSPATQSLAITVDGPSASPTVVNLASGANGCTNSAASLACTVSVNVSAGSHTYAVATYDAADATGHTLSTATTGPTTSAANQVTTVPLTLDGIVASASLAVAPASLAAGTAATATVSVIAKDAAGQTIVGPGSYVDASGTPITFTLANSDTAAGGAGQTTLAQPTLSAPGGVRVSYNGKAMYATAFSATASAPLPGGAVTGTSLAFTPTVYEYALVPGSLPFAIAVGPDGAAWFTEVLTDKIGRLTTSGRLSEFTLPSGSEPYGIATGPDNNLWIAEYGTAKIARMTTAGTVTEFSTPTAASGPYGITTGPDGNLWFTEFGSGEIGTVSTSGSIAEYAVTHVGGNGGPADIISAPDGKLWFSLYNYGYVGRMTTAGVNDAVIGGFSGAPFGLASGPDGDVWFAENRADAVGKLVPGAPRPYWSGGAQYASGVPSGASPWDIATGVDGNLWFTTAGMGAIGRATVGSSISVYTAGITGVMTSRIVVDPDGNVWFSENADDKIGKLVY